MFVDCTFFCKTRHLDQTILSLSHKTGEESNGAVGR